MVQTFFVLTAHVHNPFQIMFLKLVGCEIMILNNDCLIYFNECGSGGGCWLLVAVPLANKLILHINTDINP